MLVQSHDGTVTLLPVLPKAWATGSARGLRARGGFELDIEWQDGKLTKANILSHFGGPPAIRHAGKDQRIDFRL